MKNIKRIAIIGNAGSGKSVLAAKLHHILKLPVYHLDKYFWKPNWTHLNLDEYKIIHDQLCDQPKWIIDGMNLRVADYRLQKADMIIFLDLPRYMCFWNIFKRVFKYYGKEAPSSAPGCPEGINLKFFKFLKWVWDFKARYPEKIRTLLDAQLRNAQKNTKEIYILRSQQEINQFLEELQESEQLLKESSARYKRPVKSMNKPALMMLINYSEQTHTMLLFIGDDYYLKKITLGADQIVKLALDNESKVSVCVNNKIASTYIDNPEIVTMVILDRGGNLVPVF
jgi:adenylate kinase family enzyme